MPVSRFCLACGLCLPPLFIKGAVSSSSSKYLPFPEISVQDWECLGFPRAGLSEHSLLFSVDRLKVEEDVAEEEENDEEEEMEEEGEEEREEEEDDEDEDDEDEDDEDEET